MRFKADITRDHLRHEYINFLVEMEEGRPFFISHDKNGLRFGQRLWNKYGKDEESWPELFYEEDISKAYMLAFHELPGLV